MSTPSANLNPSVEALLVRAADFAITVRRYDDGLIVVSSNGGHPARRIRPDLFGFTAKQQRRLVADLATRGMPIMIDEIAEELRSDHLAQQLAPQAGRQCPTPAKIVFWDRAAATLAIQRISSRDGQRFTGEAVRAYHCRCGAWHTTSRR